MFSNMLDIAAFALYTLHYGNKIFKKNQWRLFLRQLSEELAKSMIEDRTQNKQIMRIPSTKYVQILWGLAV